ncbi:MAG: hypothetical protein AB8F74_01635 [Saprospiraceae bacterium]
MSKLPPKKQPELPWDPWDGEYIGNIWGRKFTLISLGIILFFLTIAIYRFATLDINTLNKVDNTEISQDSTNVN